MQENKEKKPLSLTKEQERAINARGGNLCVSASAGSGKTFVMIERMISLILNRETEVHQILALTFVKTAAAEMKEKLRKAIVKEIGRANGEEEREYFYRQLRLLPLATVGTIDSFCASLVRSYFFEADVDPNFEILSAEESTALKNEALSTVVDAAYERAEPAFMQVATAFSSNRKDNSLMEAVQKITEFAEAEEDREAFIRLCKERHSPAFFMECENALFGMAKGQLAALSAALSELAEQGQTLGYTEKGVACAKGTVSFLNECVCEEDLYGLSDKLSNFASGNLPSRNKNMEEEEKQWLTDLASLRDQMIKEKDALSKITTRAAAEKNNALAGETVNVLLALCEEYREGYAALKRRAGKMDYADLERKALILLQKPAVRAAVKERYRYVFVDEYQDVNGMQEAIFSLISENNLFIVGDVKQSIYAFRGCNPNLFLQKIEQAKKEKSHVALNRNFRSAKEILEGVNAVFNTVMTEQSADIDYLSEQLEFGEGYPVGEGRVKTVFYAEQEKDALPSGVYSVKDAHERVRNKADAQSSAICRLVEGLVGKEMISEGKDKPPRPVTYGDIAILYRSGTNVGRIAEALRRRDIPVSQSLKTPLTDSPEVRLLLAVLKLANAEKEDIPFVTVLLSPIGKMEEGELAEIRAYAKKQGGREISFYDAAVLYASRKDGNRLYEQTVINKLRAVFTLVEELTEKAALVPAAELLEEVCVRYSLRAAAYAKHMGKRRVRMMDRLLFEGKAADGTGIFTGEFLRRVEEAGEELCYTESDGGGGVKMMTMHASKGLEFPVVILCELQKTFNGQDARGPVLLERELGVLPCAFNPENRTKGETLQRILFHNTYKKNRAKEEMRLLYVAMTRAKNRMYLVLKEGIEALIPQDLPEAEADTRYYLTLKEGSARELAQKITGVNNYAKWLAGWFAPLDLEGAGKTEAGAEGNEKAPEGKAEDSAGEGEREKRGILLSGGEDLAAAIKEARAFAYPYPKAVVTPEKQTVTGILAREHENAKEETKREISSAKEKEARLLGTEERILRGVRIHAFMEKCDLSFRGEAAVLSAMRECVNKGELTEEDLSAAPMISNVLASSLMQEVRQGKVFREREFTMLSPVEGEEDSVVQGVIDLLSVAEDGIVLVDYKNSVLSDEALKSTYRKQLELYSLAAQKFYGIKIKKRAIINLSNGSIIDL